jgi:hypothetical protein
MVNGWLTCLNDRPGSPTVTFGQSKYLAAIWQLRSSLRHSTRRSTLQGTRFPVCMPCCFGLTAHAFHRIYIEALRDYLESTATMGCSKIELT